MRGARAEALQPRRTHPGRRPEPPRPDPARTPRRRPRGRRRLEPRPVRGRRGRRGAVRAGRGRHEGHGRHDAGQPAPPGQQPHHPAARHRVRVPRRRGGGRGVGSGVDRTEPAGAVRGLLRGDQRGWRLLDHAATGRWRPGDAVVPPPDRGKGLRVDAVACDRTRRPWIRAERRERDRAACRGDRADRCVRLGDRPDPARDHSVRPRQRRDGHPVERRRPRRLSAAARRCPSVRRRDAREHREPHDAARGQEVERHPRRRGGVHRLPLPSRLGRQDPRDAARACGRARRTDRRSHGPAARRAADRPAR